MDAKKTKKIVVLATGGTIAGLASDPSKPQNYQAGQVSVADLLGPSHAAHSDIESEQVAQIDSKDMGYAVWQQLLQRVAHHLARDDVHGVVITHGTDTVEETAYFLQAVLQPAKPVALTCAMRAANAPDADGPANLQQALAWVQLPQAQGVAVVASGEVHGGATVQKLHSQQLNPFASDPMRAALQPVPTVAQVLACTAWPRVEVVMNHAGADGRLVRAAMAQADAPQGWVVAGTGNGTVHQDLQAALLDAQAQSATVWRSSRCAWGGVQSREGDVFPHAGLLSVAQARVALVLALIAQQAR
jgi:L-asparaginase